MLMMFQPVHSDYFADESPRQLRRELQKQRASTSTISRREFEHKRRMRKIADKSRSHNRKFH